MRVTSNSRTFVSGVLCPILAALLFASVSFAQSHGQFVPGVAQGIDIGNDRQWDDWARREGNRQESLITSLKTRVRFDSATTVLFPAGARDSRALRATIFPEQGMQKVSLTGDGKNREYPCETLLKRAMLIVRDQPWFIVFAQDFEVYCLNPGSFDNTLKHTVLTRGSDFKPVFRFIISDLTDNYRRQHGRWDTPLTNLIHDIGHALHERSGGKNGYWARNGRPTNGGRINALAQTSEREFVAEMFTAKMLNAIQMQYLNYVPEFTEYERLGGYPLGQNRPQGLPQWW